MFQFSRRLTGSVPPLEFYEGAAGETLVLGEALTLDGGKLKKAGPTEKPSLLCAGVARSDGLFPVVRLTPNIELETKSTATIPESLIGSAVTLHTDGLRVTATTASGVFTISATDGAENNSRVCGFFN